MKNATTRKTLVIFWNYTRRYFTDFIIGAGGAALAVILQGMIPPFIVSRLFNRLQIAFSNHEHLTFHDVLPYFYAYAAAMLFGVIVWRLQSFFVWQLEEKVKRDQANDIYNHLQSQSQRFHSDRFGGALVSQTNKFMSGYERLMDDTIWNIIPGIVTTIVAIVVLLFVSPAYSLVIFLVVVFYLLLMSKRIAKQMPYNRVLAAAESHQTASLADAITNMNAIHGYAQESYESERFRKVSNKLHHAYKNLSVEVLKSEAVSHVQTNGFQIIAVLAGLIAITQYGASISLLYLMLSYTQNIVNNLYQFSRIVRNVNRSLGDSIEMTEILSIEPEIKDLPKPKTSKIHRGEVVFNNVEFSYPEDKSPLFKNFNLKIKQGEKVGLVGSSGGGKTTVTKLLMRFVDIQSGEITIDGQNIVDIRQTDLRKAIAYVPQEPLLFHRSIKENINYANPDASNREVEGVAKLANAHDFIKNLPAGYETLVGERGIKLSGGQRQRIVIARAMLKNAPILVLDEATSALDSESEVFIQSALWRLMEGRTAIVIAHRLSTIQKMDRIIVLDKGTIIEQGSHKELLNIKGTYAKLWAHQSGGFMEE